MYISSVFQEENDLVFNKGLSSNSMSLVKRLHFIMLLCQLPILMKYFKSY